MTNFKTIKIGKGLGHIKFGMDRKEVASSLGEPDEKDQFKTSEFGKFKTEAWHYDKMGVSLGFEEEERWRLSNISITAEDCTLEGEKVIGMSQLALINHLKNSGFDDLEIEEDDGQTVVSSEEKSINFWLEEGTVIEVQWMPFLLDEYTIKWP